MSDLQKPFKNVDEEIQILQSRGLIIANVDDAKAKLLNNNYYTVINGYKYPFLEKLEPPLEERYKEGASFDEIFSLYEFDCQLRALLLKYILRVEHKLKSVISHVFAGKYRDIPYPDYLDRRYFDIENSKKNQDLYKNLRNHIGAEIAHQKENNNQILFHYEKKYQNIPPWILVSFLSFGMMRIFYCCLKNQDQNDIGKKFKLFPDTMKDYLSALNIYRNSCAHDERIYNSVLRNKVVRKNARGDKTEYNRVYVVILILKDMLDAATFMTFYAELDTCINTLKNSLKTIDISDIFRAMGMPEDSAVRKAELGPLEHGDALSLQEFHDVLERYILPILPIPVELLPTPEDDEIRINPRRTLVSYENNRLYFSQSIEGNFVYYVSVPNQSAIDGQIETIQDHLTALIDFIHVFWNLSNLSIYDRDKVEIAFPNLCEQAYALTICSLMCRKESEGASRRFNDAKMRYKRACGTVSTETLKDLKAEVDRYRDEYQQVVQNETRAQQSLYRSLTQIETWANKTYEGQKKTFGIILNRSELPSSGASFNYIEFLKSDYSATINDGLYSAVELYVDGSFKAHISICASSESRFPSIPYPFTGFAELCTDDKIGILLAASGDIFIISGQKLCYTKHNGFWLRCNADKVITQIMTELDMDDLDRASAIYQTITDLSYSRGGACIGIVQEDALSDELLEMIEGGLLSAETADAKQIAIRNLIMNNGGSEKKSFYELDRYLRRELLELDGATVFSRSGLIHVIGTIIKLNGSGSTGGGRTAAAMQLSEFGLAIKISQDGYVQLFKNREKILEILT